MPRSTSSPQEPLPESSVLRTLDNVIITPHVAGFGGTALRARMATIVADNVRRYMAGESLRNVVDLQHEPGPAQRTGMRASPSIS